MGSNIAPPLLLLPPPIVDQLPNPESLAPPQLPFQLPPKLKAMAKQSKNDLYKAVGKIQELLVEDMY